MVNPTLEPLCDYINLYLRKEHILLNTGNSRETDVLVLGGGTQFYSFPNTKSNARLNILKSILNNPLFLFDYLNKRKKKNGRTILQTKTAALGLGIGPFLGPDTQSAINRTSDFINKVDFLMLRDSTSVNFAKEHLKNKETTLIQSYDLCFAPER